MTREGTNQKIASYYERLIEQHGHSPLSCDFGSTASQTRKFEIIAGATDFSNKTILDIGCGFGDFVTYLKQEHTGFNYHGVDITPKMVEMARSQHPDTRFECRDVLQDPPDRIFDIVTSNGIFYLSGDNGWPFMKDMITQMFGLCTKVVAFNTLSTWADFMNEEEFYADPVETLAFCHSLTPYVTMRHDYMTHDFTVYLYRGQP